MKNSYSSQFFYPETLVHLLRHRAEHQPDDRALTYLVDGEFDEVHWTYAQLDTRARAIGAWLESIGLENKRALMLYPPGMEFVAAFFGCLYAGVTAVPTNPPRRNHKLTRIESIVEDAEATVALTTESVLDTVGGLLVESPLLKSLTWQATDVAQAGLEDKWQMPEVDGETLAFLQYTSGSTGTPKGVMLSHDNLMHNCAVIQFAFENTRSTTGIIWLPSYHDMGLIGGILQPMYVARPTLLMSPMSFLQKPFRWLKAITNYRGTTSGGPNFAYDLCVDKITPTQMKELDLSSWKVAFNGAEPVRADTIDRFSEKFAACGFRREAFYPCYGMAEATLIVAGGHVPQEPVIRSFDAEALERNEIVQLNSDRGGRRLVGCGHAMPDQVLVIADPATKATAAPNKIGEIWVQGPSIAKGYLKRPEENAHTFGAHLSDTGEGPFLRTGDLGFMADGELFVTGRMKNLIIIHGKNYYPQDIEQTVGACHPRMVVDAGAAFTLEDEGKQRLIIVQEVDRQRDRNEAEIIDAIRKAVAAEHQLGVDAVALVRLRSIPKTSSGKIQHYACREMYEKGELTLLSHWRLGDPLDVSQSSPDSTTANGGTCDAQSKSASPEAPPQAGRMMTSVGSATAPRGTNGSAVSEGNEPSVPLSGSVEEVVQAVVRRVGHERATTLTLETNIVELGLDSIERMEIVATLEDAYGGRFPESVLIEMETCQQVVDGVKKHLGTELRQRPTTPVEIPAENYQFEKTEDYQQLKGLEHYLTSTGLPNPFFNVQESASLETTVVEGVELTNFSSFNYLGMSGDPTIGAAAKEAIDRFGTSASASRLVAGEMTIHGELERAIAGWIGTDDAIAMVSGHSTNVTTIGHLFGPGDLVLHDALAHNSIVQGCILSGARRRPFPHNDWQTLDRMLNEIRGDYRRVLIAIEGVYSMDGDYCDLPAFVDVKKRHKSFLLIDEAHSVGTMGAHGRGLSEFFDVQPADVDFWMGTLSKAFGSSGGFIAGSAALIEYLKYTAPAFVFSTGLSPADTAAALAAIRLLEESPDRVARLAENSKLFLALATEAGLNTGTSRGTPIVPIILGNSRHCLDLSSRLRDRGINARPILYPAVEENASRVRFFITATHTELQIRDTVTAVAEELAAIDPAHVATRSQCAAKQNLV